MFVPWQCCMSLGIFQLDPTTAHFNPKIKSCHRKEQARKIATNDDKYEMSTVQIIKSPGHQTFTSLRHRTWAPTPFPATDIWWSSLGTCLNLFTWNPPPAMILTSNGGYWNQPVWLTRGRFAILLDCSLVFPTSLDINDELDDRNFHFYTFGRRRLHSIRLDLSMVRYKY